MSSVLLCSANSAGNVKKAPLEIIVLSVSNNGWHIASLSVVVQALSNCCSALVFFLLISIAQIIQLIKNLMISCWY